MPTPSQDPEQEPVDSVVLETSRLCLWLLLGAVFLSVMLLVCFVLWKRLTIP